MSPHTAEIQPHSSPEDMEVQEQEHELDMNGFENGGGDIVMDNGVERDMSTLTNTTASRNTGPSGTQKSKRESVEKGLRKGDAEFASDEQRCIAYLRQHFPSIFDHFKDPIELVGEGGFGVVYKARPLDPSKFHDHQVVALKLFYPHKCTLPERVKEYSNLNKLSNAHCPNIPHVIGLMQHNDYTVIAMEYFEHHPSKSYRKDLTLSEIQIYMKKLLETLKFLKDKRYIHRDIKQDNVLFNRKTLELRLVDFGLAHEVNSNRMSMRSETQQKRTNQSTLEPDPPKRQRANSESARTAQSHTLSSQLNKIPVQSAAQTKQGSPNDTSTQLPHTELMGNFFANTSHQNAGTTQSTSSQQKQTQNGRVTQPRQPPSTRETKKRDFPAPKTLYPNANSNGSKRISSDRRSVPSRREEVGRQNAATTKDSFRVVEGRRYERQFQVPAGGTRGYRAPEVLLGSLDTQTTAIDMWSAGTILLSLASGRPAFFQAQDDKQHLAQICKLMGYACVEQVARQAMGVLIGRQDLNTEKGKSDAEHGGCPLGYSLKDVCEYLRALDRYAERKKQAEKSSQVATTETNQITEPPRDSEGVQNGTTHFQAKSHQTGQPPNKTEKGPNVDVTPAASNEISDISRDAEGWQNEQMWPDSLYDLLMAMLQLDPKLRISPEDALRHPFFSEKVSWKERLNPPLAGNVE